MRAVVFQGPGQVSVEAVHEPEIEEPTDAIVRITTSALCGSDLHMYEGRTAAQPGIVFGHEPLGVVAETGSGVRSLQPGDRVVMPFNISCGFCANCTRGYFNACLTLNPDNAGAAYGYVGMGPHRGGQADLLRVPYADVNALKLPGEPGDEWEDDFVLLADVFPTGYHATEMAGVQPGDTVAVYGAGPVGLLTALSARIRGAAEVYVVDRHADRLTKASEIGAVPIDFEKAPPTQLIREMRAADPTITRSLRAGEEKMLGVTVGIDAVGYQANDEEDPSRERATQAVDDLAELVNPTGRINLIGVFLPQDPGAADPHAQQGRHGLPLGTLWNKGITVSGGQANVKQYNARLRDLIVAGRARPSFIVSQRLPLTEAPVAFQRFDERADGFTKVVFKPGLAA
ncbi:MAG TPA: glutathione-independent formaldehyde dehydrogenase [Candidatus Binatia bacterium]|jgi:glutathione-independent formaldehyde dehydrogenase|nr:glutathione-independent formaldehyde dehydrogenase [Candidatus Binatia bacterium]